LAREARTRGAERYTLVPLLRIFEHSAHVINSASDHNHFGEKTIRTGIRGEANEIDGTAEYAVWTKQCYQIIA
jgi:hypothetical protein